MQTITLPEPLELIINEVSLSFLVRTLLLGLVTFLLFFLILKSMDKHHTKEKIIQAIRQRWEYVLYGDSILLVRNGILQLDKLYKANITTQQVFNAMRSQNITNLNNIKLLYVNPDNEFRIYSKNNTSTISVIGKEPLTENLRSLKEIN